MKFDNFSKKQLQVMTWWTEKSPYHTLSGIICDGSVRSGKSLSMAVSFIFWAMATFNEQQFGMSGKSVGSFNRNIIFWLTGVLKLRGYKVVHNRGENFLQVRVKDHKTKKIHTNYFYIFGGSDERSYQTVQGITTAGWFFDEVALQPESFVNQAIARCSVEGSKLWFNCNPDRPLHWFKVEFIDKAKEKKFLHIHFIMEDNPSLSKSTIERYKTMYSGVFYLRYVLGLWALAEGIIYDMLTEENYYESILDTTKWESTRYVCIDYGTTNPMAVYSVYDNWTNAYVDDEYYYDSRAQGKQKTDQQYADEIEAFIARESQAIEAIILDPSAASFKAEMRSRGYRVKDADNDVVVGIRVTASAFQQKKLLINKRNCPNLIGELGGYVWDETAKDRGVEKPVKERDHGCDSIRYFTNTIMRKRIEGRV